MSEIAICGGRVLDPASRTDRRLDVLVQDGRIAALKAPGRSGPHRKGRTVLDASGLLVMPGLIDCHVHLRQPGMTRAESVASGTRAAAAGGFTTVVCMPNTRPPLDNPAVVRRLGAVVRREALVRVLPTAALSRGLAGQVPTDFEALLQAGAFGLSDDGVGTERPEVLAQALACSAREGVVVFVHPEDRGLSAGGVLRAGPVARRLGFAGIPPEAEVRRVVRDIGLLRQHGGRLHLQHLSTVGAIEAVRRAKRRGLPVSAEATPHHLTLTDADIPSDPPDPNFKMNPPLGRPAEREALRRALQDGTIDAIATDHAPHLRAAKARGFAAAPFGIIGLETALPLTLRLVEEGALDLQRAVELLTWGPARLLGLKSGRLAVGLPADIAIVDSAAVFEVGPETLHSRSRNTPFSGWTLHGRAVYTLVAGRVVHRLSDR